MCVWVCMYHICEWCNGHVRTESRADVCIAVYASRLIQFEHALLSCVYGCVWVIYAYALRICHTRQGTVERALVVMFECMCACVISL